MGLLGRRQFLIAASATLAAPSLYAQQPAKVPRIGYLSWASPSLHKVLTVGFLQGLRERGYVEGQSIVIEDRRGATGQLPDLAAELVRLKVDVIATVGTPAALAAKRATSTIPIVITLVTDPVDSGLVPSLARPGGNITGLSMLAPEVFAKALELLKQAAPRISSVAVLMDPTNHGHIVNKKQIDAAGNALGVNVQRIDVQTSADIDRAVAAAPGQHADAFYVFPLRISDTDWQRIIEFGRRNRVPTLVSNKDHVEVGALMSYGLDFVDQVRRTGVYIDKILKGAKPADLPLERPTKFELMINMKTAKALGLTIPPTVLLRADRVIE